jgi:hypothetical protein
MGKTKIFKEQYEEIIELYKNGLSAQKIAQKYNVCRNTIVNILYENNICGKDRQTIYNKHKDEMCEMYINGSTLKEIAEFYHINEDYLCSKFNQWGVPRRHRKYQLNEHYFDDINTANKAYILGLLYADGCNNVSNNVVHIKLQEQDKGLLEMIRLELECESPLHFVAYKNKQYANGKNCQDQYRLSLNSACICKALEDKGMPQCKSLILQWPTFLSNDLYSHFVRGYMDGDGHICPYKSDYRVEFVGTGDFCRAAQKYIEHNLNIKCKVVDAGTKNSITSRVRISHKEQVKIFLDWIYDGADLKLDRKYHTYVSKYCSEENINNTLINVAS